MEECSSSSEGYRSSQGRLAESTDSALAEYIQLMPNVPEFLRTAMSEKLTSEDFEALIEEVKRRRPSETGAK